MRNLQTFHRLAAALLLASGLVAGCSSDSPTRPAPGGGGGTPPPPPTNQTFAITVTSTSSELLASPTASAIINISVRRTDNGQAPPNGATITVNTSRGSFGSPNSGNTSVILQLTNGAVAIELFGGTVEGTAVVQAVMGSSVGQVQIRITLETAFGIFGVQPSVGAPEGGDTMVITGQGIKAPVSVEFDLQSTGSVQDASGTILSVTSTQITVRVPPSPVSVGVGQTQVTDVVITHALGTAEQRTQRLDGAFTYALGGSILRPAVSSVTPNQGPNEGGTRIRIQGDGFQAPVQVLFGTGDPNGFQGLEATVESVSRTEIVAITPAAIGIGQDNTNESVNVLVRNIGNGFAGVGTRIFRYGQTAVFISAAGPTAGSYLGGTIVTIDGSGFDEPVAVGGGTVAWFPISVSGSKIVARTAAVPLTGNCQDVTGPISVVNVETGQSAIGPDFRYVVPRPIVTNIAPPRAVVPAAGIPVTITGVNFEDPSQVFFGNQRGNNPVVSGGGSIINVIAPPFNGTFRTETCTVTEGGRQLAGTRQREQTVDIRVVSSLTTCESTLTGAFTFVPEDQTCRPNQPNASFSSTVNGLTVTFQNNSTNFATAVWNFGDNSSSGLINPTHSYAPGVPGTDQTYVVTLTVSNSSGSDSTSASVTVTTPGP